MKLDTRSSADVARELSMAAKAPLGIYPLPARTPAPSKCPHCGHVTNAIVCNVCKRPM